MNLFERHWNARRSMSVRRYHQYSVNEIDTVGKHSCGVAALVLVLLPNPRAALLEYAIIHDFAEIRTGDIPADAKRALSDSSRHELKASEEAFSYELGWPCPELTEDEHQLLKVCDYLDGLTYCIEERRRGNMNLLTVGNTYLKYLPAYLDSPNLWCARARELMTNLARQWNDLYER